MGNREFRIASFPVRLGKPPVGSVIRFGNLQGIAEQFLRNFPLPVVHRLKALTGQSTGGDRLSTVPEATNGSATRQPAEGD
jgi:hypothetical protein